MVPDASGLEAHEVVGSYGETACTHCFPDAPVRGATIYLDTPPFDYLPHGSGDIWQWGRPPFPTDEPVELEPHEPFSAEALRFLNVLGPLDRKGWATLANAPVGGWPAAEILPAIDDCIGPYVPIDIIGMLTDRNPGGLYLPGDEVSP
jgi:hypothetical protein